MKKNLKYSSFAICSLAVLALSSCTNEPSGVAPVDVQQSQLVRLGNATVSVQDNRLVFPDTTSFKSALFTVDKADTKVLTAWESDHKFQSLFSATKAIEQELDKVNSKEEATAVLSKRDALAKVGDPSFAHLLNKDGYVQIGKSVYRVTPDKRVLEVDESKVSLLANPKSMDASVRIFNIETKTTEHIETINPVGVASASKGSANARDKAPDENYTPLNGDHRMVWGYKQENYGVYSTAVALTQCQYYQTYVFRPNEWRISQDSQVSVNVSYARIYYWISGQESYVYHNNVSDQSSTGSAFFRLGYAAGIGAVTQVAEIHASHSLTWSSYNRTFSY